MTVSYTHLDVYKRQEQNKAKREEFWANVEGGKTYTGVVKSLTSYGALFCSAVTLLMLPTILRPEHSVTTSWTCWPTRAVSVS